MSSDINTSGKPDVSARDDRRPNLTPHQKLRAAKAVLCDGVDQMIVADLMGTNVGRVNEATQAVRRALGFPMRNTASNPLGVGVDATSTQERLPLDEEGAVSYDLLPAPVTMNKRSSNRQSNTRTEEHH